MADERIVENVIRYVRLREELKPLPIFAGHPPEPINVDWVGISHSISKTSQWTDARESYLVNFYAGDGELLECLQFDTLDIALDQSHAIAGIARNEWRNCNVDVSDDGSVPWSRVSS